MITAMFKTRRTEGARELFASIPARGLVPSVETCVLMMTNLIKQGLLEEADDIFSSMVNAGFDPDSRLLNHVVRALLNKHEIVRAGNYLSKIDEKNFFLDDSTTILLVDLFKSSGTCKEQIRYLPEKYHFLAGSSPI
jgi:pentatricopeptide repeat protein